MPAERIRTQTKEVEYRIVWIKSLPPVKDDFRQKEGPIAKIP